MSEYRYQETFVYSSKVKDFLGGCYVKNYVPMPLFTAFLKSIGNHSHQLPIFYVFRI